MKPHLGFHDPNGAVTLAKKMAATYSAYTFSGTVTEALGCTRGSFSAPKKRRSDDDTYFAPTARELMVNFNSARTIEDENRHVSKSTAIDVALALIPCAPQTEETVTLVASLLKQCGGSVAVKKESFLTWLKNRPTLTEQDRDDLWEYAPPNSEYSEKDLTSVADRCFARDSLGNFKKTLLNLTNSCNAATLLGEVYFKDKNFMYDNHESLHAQLPGYDPSVEAYEKTRELVEAVHLYFNKRRAVIGDNWLVKQDIGKYERVKPWSQFYGREDSIPIFTKSQLKTGEEKKKCSHQTISSIISQNCELTLRYSGVVFDPALTPELAQRKKKFNLWTGITAIDNARRWKEWEAEEYKQTRQPQQHPERTEEIMTMFLRILDYIKTVICYSTVQKESDDLYKQFERWLITLLNKPGEPDGSVVLIEGRGGSGKSSFFTKFLPAVLGKGYVQVYNGMASTETRWSNALLEGKLLAVIEEALPDKCFGEDLTKGKFMKMSQNMKFLSTVGDGTVSVEKKGKDHYDIQCFARQVMISDIPGAFAAGCGEDDNRRLHVYNLKPKSLDPDERAKRKLYFEDLHAYLEGKKRDQMPVLATMFCYYFCFKQRDDLNDPLPLPVQTKTMKLMKKGNGIIPTAFIKFMKKEHELLLPVESVLELDLNIFIKWLKEKDNNLMTEQQKNNLAILNVEQIISRCFGFGFDENHVTKVHESVVREKY